MEPLELDGSDFSNAPIRPVRLTIQFPSNNIIGTLLSSMTVQGAKKNVLAIDNVDLLVLETVVMHACSHAKVYSLYKQRVISD